MQITIMSESLLLNSKYIEMGREEGGFQVLLRQLPLVIVCHDRVNHLAVTHLRFCNGLKCQCSMPCQAESVIKLLKFKATSP